MRLPSIVLLVLLALLAWSRPAHASISYDNCTGFITTLPTTISAPGTWCMNQDLATTITSGSAITIAASDVILDCNDFQLMGIFESSSRAVGVSASQQSDVRVRHCRFQDFYTGVSLVSSVSPDSRNVVEDNRFETTYNTAIQIQGKDDAVRRNVICFTGQIAANSGSAIQATGTEDVIDNTISQMPNAGGAAISMAPGEGSTVIANHLGGLPPGASEAGISLSGNPRVAVRDNALVGSTSGNATGAGVGCNAAGASAVRVHYNVISAFTQGIVGCADAGENTVTP